MFKILEKTFRTGIATVPYPQEPARVSEHFRGRPVFDFANWHDARPAAEICPTGAITVDDEGGQKQVAVDYGRCIFCGQCAEVSINGAVTITQEFEMATRDRGDLILTSDSIPGRAGQQAVGDSLRTKIHDVLGRSLAIRQVDAGSCNGCELEINALNNPVHDIERFGIHFVASPRHADMLLVTGPVTRNMELALRKTYDATPKPKVVVAVGACGISGGIFGVNYATRGGVDQVIPVDVFIPGCPPRPEALLHGILLAVGRLA
jgi:Ni,Fe-hydrogenase III small subunit/formate hydrogenlyase subunit 6/NADH:ubiquinone oxidoreductase subunit I